MLRSFLSTSRKRCSPISKRQKCFLDLDEMKLKQHLALFAFTVNESQGCYPLDTDRQQRPRRTAKSDAGKSGAHSRGFWLFGVPGLRYKKFADKNDSGPPYGFAPRLAMPS
ncbi:unnamed protein product [Amoebophrya sp. A120]|nr:unnamed protein product [Amoebophrya sp. A120]|eukprot:GSA120T00011773001.1